MTSQNERILFIINHFCEGNKAEFARKVGEKPQTVNGWLKRPNGLSVLNKILEAFNEVNNTWLITGEGEMLANPNALSESTPYDGTALVEKFETLLEDYEDMKQQRDYWREKAQDLEYQLAKLKAG